MIDGDSHYPQLPDPAAAMQTLVERALDHDGSVRDAEALKILADPIRGDAYLVAAGSSPACLRAWRVADEKQPSRL
jgi:hypothetical protein